MWICPWEPLEELRRVLKHLEFEQVVAIDCEASGLGWCQVFGRFCRWDMSLIKNSLSDSLEKDQNSLVQGHIMHPTHTWVVSFSKSFCRPLTFFVSHALPICRSYLCPSTPTWHVRAQTFQRGCWFLQERQLESWSNLYSWNSLVFCKSLASHHLCLWPSESFRGQICWIMAGVNNFVLLM